MESPKRTLNIAIAGLGTVGIGTFKILQEKFELLQQRCGHTALVVKAVSARSQKDRGVDLSGVEWVENAVDLASMDNIDLVLELIGGSEGVAYDLCKKALQNGKHVITANKALIAHHGIELATIAEAQNVHLMFEAAVAGGIPILKGLKEGLGANSFHNITGILNGTSNYILTEMEQTGRDFAAILKDAQAAGYAEADPTFDVEGIDAAHKLTIITSIAYGVQINFEQLYVEGISKITIDDIRYAASKGYKIRLLGICERHEEGILQRVYPCMVPVSHPIAKVDGVYNAIVAQCDEAGKSVFEGRGAGEQPTASSVIADIMDIANNRASFPFNVSVKDLAEASFMDINQREGEYYIRLQVEDKAGVLADIASIFSQNGISIRTLIQKDATTKGEALLIITTHQCVEQGLTTALRQINQLVSIKQEAFLIRIENL